MKHDINPHSALSHWSADANAKRHFKPLHLALLSCAAGLALAAGPTVAANLLVNPVFEENSGHNIPLGWTRFAPPTAAPFGDYWIENNPPVATNGLLYWKEWGACYNGTNNVAGINQDFSSAPGSTYQADGFFFTLPTDMLGADCFTWIEVSFLGASSNLLALYKSANFNASVGTSNWFDYPVTNACDVTAPVSLGDPFFTTYAVTGAVSQIVAPIGTKTIRYRYAYLQYQSEGGSAYFDTANLNQVSGPIAPVITNLYPLNMIFVVPGDGLSFNVSSPSGFAINNTNIHVVLNGVDVSAGLVISGSSSNKNVAFHGLQSNTTYTASITVTDAFDLTVSASSYFETTWVGIPPVLYLWEAEDFDFSSGMYYDNPTLCVTTGSSNCYFGTVGVELVDEHKDGNPAPTHLYRPSDPIGTVLSGDYARKDHVLAGVQDYRIDPFDAGEWVNYTRDWSNATYWVIGRLSTDISLAGTFTLSVVNPDTTTTDLGTFAITNGLGWTTYENVYLKDTNGRNANITLSGKTTLRLTADGNDLRPGFFMLVAAQPDLPFLSNMYPTGTQPFEYTNTFSFTVTTPGATFPPNGIDVNLDGLDVTSNLVITGSTSNKGVVYPGLLPNAVHLAIITVTNSLGHGFRVTNSFDTFTQANFMVEAEDFDYDGGQYVTNWYPDAYQGFGADTNIDFLHTTLSNECCFAYRPIGVPQDIAHDFLRDTFINYGAFDYSLTYFAGADWANYTRVYPAGSFYVYGRFSGDDVLGFTMFLDQVVSGAATFNQSTTRLGQWSAIGKAPSYQAYSWVPLTDGGLVAPAVVKLNGLSTLRITTAGNCNPNYFMLVPVSGISLSATRSAGNVVLSFPTQAGATYRVFYRNDLATGTWTLLTTVVGNGSVESVRDPSTGTRRFYRVVAP